MVRRARRPLAALRRELQGVELRLRLALALSNRLPPYTFSALRLRLLRLGGIRVGPRTGVGGRLRVAGGAKPASRLTIGADCFINDDCRFDVSAPIEVGDDVYLGHEVAVLAATHVLGGPHRRAGAVAGKPIRIERGAWVGARATILAGVTIGAGSVVAAGAVVSSSVPPHTMVGGVPARAIRELA